jgi:hypothetical protein
VTPDGSSVYTWQAIVNKGNKDWFGAAISSAGFLGGDGNACFDLNNGVVGSINGCITALAIADMGGGWYLVSCQVTSDAAAASNIVFRTIDDDLDYTFAGDSSTPNSVLWNPQFGVGSYPGPIILTEAAAVTRAADVVYWPSAKVPGAILSGKYAFKWIPFATDVEYGASNVFLQSIDANNGILFAGSTDRIRVFAGGAEKVASNALNFSRYSTLTVTIDAAAGSITVSGASSGDGTVVGTAWSWSAGNLYYGCRFDSTSQIDGLISEPYSP